MITQTHLTSKKVLVASALVVAASLTLFLAIHANAQAAVSTPQAILQKSGNLNSTDPTINRLELAPKQQDSNNLGNSSIFGASLPIVFRLMGQSIFGGLTDPITVYGDTAIDMLYAGFTSSQSGNEMVESITPTKLHVNGSIMVKSLASPGAPAEVPVCVNDVGVLSRC